MHASNQSATWGTAFTISYQSEVFAVTMENMDIFNVLGQ